MSEKKTELNIFIEKIKAKHVELERKHWSWSAFYNGALEAFSILYEPKHETDKKYIALGKAFELFLSNERFRILGTAELGKSGYQHIGMEIWTKHKDFPEDWNETNKQIIYKYILGMKGKDGFDYGEGYPTIENLISAFTDLESKS